MYFHAACENTLYCVSEWARSSTCSEEKCKKINPYHSFLKGGYCYYSLNSHADVQKTQKPSPSVLSDP